MSKPKAVEIVNRKASFSYEILDSLVAGIMLTGTEVKSIRSGGGSIQEAYCIFRNGELYIRQMNIPVYSHGNIQNHEPLSVRKLLLKKKEMERLEAKVKERGISIIPLRIFFNERGFVKIEIALARGKKSFDKRESIKKRESKVELNRVKKMVNRKG